MGGYSPPKKFRIRCERCHVATSLEKAQIRHLEVKKILNGRGSVILITIKRNVIY